MLLQLLHIILIEPSIIITINALIHFQNSYMRLNYTSFVFYWGEVKLNLLRARLRLLLA